MASIETGRYCPRCNDQVLARRVAPTHIVHAVVTMFTFGLWALVWIDLSMRAKHKPWLCTRCGSETDEVDDYEGGLEEETPRVLTWHEQQRLKKRSQR